MRLIQKINGNMGKVLLLYSDQSESFSGAVNQRLGGAGSDRCSSIHPNLTHPIVVIHLDATLGQGLTIIPFNQVIRWYNLGHLHDLRYIKEAVKLMETDGLLKKVVEFDEIVIPEEQTFVSKSYKLKWADVAH
ncbi:hypothetical protein Droror1_Dr00024537 [Drosera rotundifolia]